ncbi:hypothetical protein P8452_14716 [Trifolium repens]|nr:hypothetical protein P8452_14716 [Trifolium repens]
MVITKPIVDHFQSDRSSPAYLVQLSLLFLNPSSLTRSTIGSVPPLGLTSKNLISPSLPTTSTSILLSSLALT